MKPESKSDLKNDLKDPKGDRVVRTVPPPPQRPLLDSQIFLSNTECNWKLLRDHLKRGGKIEQKEFVKMIDITTSILSTPLFTQGTNLTSSTSATQ